MIKEFLSDVKNRKAAKKAFALHRTDTLFVAQVQGKTSLFLSKHESILQKENVDYEILLKEEVQSFEEDKGDQKLTVSKNTPKNAK